MPARNDALRSSLSQSSELNITVTGRRTGRSISIPVWFVLEGDELYLLPVKGSDTQWYKNVLKNPTIRIEAGRAQAELQAVPTTDPSQVSSVAEKFRAKYGRNDVKKYYSKLDVAVAAKIKDAVTLHWSDSGRGSTEQLRSETGELNSVRSIRRTGRLQDGLRHVELDGPVVIGVGIAATVFRGHLVR